MGIIRSTLLVIAGVILFFLLVSGNTFLTISMSLEKENVNQETSRILAEMDFKDEVITFADSILPLMNMFCFKEDVEINLGNNLSVAPCSVVLEGKENLENYLFNESEELEDNSFTIYNEICTPKENYLFNFKNYSVNVSCDAISNGSEYIATEFIRGLVEKSYYESYNCSGIKNCFQEARNNPFFLLSLQTKDYFQAKFYWILPFILIFVGVILILVENRSNFPFAIGLILIFSSLPFLKLYEIVSFIFRLPVLEFVTVFFSKSSVIFWSCFVIGLILIGLSIVIKTFKFGFKVEGFFSRFSKKEE